MALTLDHVPFAWSDLESIRAEFEALGLATEYGGVHDNDVTHMAVLGFDDRSYVELISERRPGEHDYWATFIRGDAGPAHWAIRVEDIDVACARLRDAGVTVRGPVYGSRERADGRLVEWDGALLGGEDDRVLPFLIADRTPLGSRVSPSPSVAEGPLTGVDEVVLGVRSIDDAVESLRVAFGMPPPQRRVVEPFGTVAAFPGQPVAVTSPDGPGWLTDRLERFGEAPCACLLGTHAIEAVRENHPLGDPHPWPNGRVAFFESDRVGRHLGVVERRSG